MLVYPAAGSQSSQKTDCKKLQNIAMSLSAFIWRLGVWHTYNSSLIGMRNQYNLWLRHQSRQNTEFSECQALSETYSATGSLNASYAFVRVLIPITAKIAVTSTDSAAKTK